MSVFAELDFNGRSVTFVKIGTSRSVSVQSG